jgi:HPr kinase/phosphorylase
MPHQPKPFKKDAISVAYAVKRLEEDLGVVLETLVEGEAGERMVVENILHRPGLVLAGYDELFTHQRVQVLGNTETQFLDHLPPEERREAFARLLRFPIPCIILTENNELEAALVDLARAAGVPLYRTALPTTDFMAQLRDVLVDQFALNVSIHACLVDVYGVGLLLIGKSGIGKSEVALDLVERGHRLVADDVVIATKKASSVLMGSGTNLVQHFMEIRGLGLVDVRAMFGIRAIRFQKRIEVAVNMELWEPGREYTRLGMVDDTYDLLGVKLPLVKVPVTPGKNITVLCEVIAMNHLLRHYGYDPAEVFTKRLGRHIRSKAEGGAAHPLRNVEWFEQDLE